ncbi:cation channel sperm-associated protein 2 isoform X1 [Phascolarctos cinereus]|uniref:Cation channel sperm-associated protein 2 n=1 Tax=Phascolarctos cinereus TaxID=38626 RepID=A0A6P5M4Z3_PHACI|nr:cation channel sperm-associated protein 2 isoform X1 [Phascolarctos cinereus]XP_020864898.1 cation channel sperm-associated protein 2 isoform X1 [Phascolarctos cinereus]XP_020864899.1 cation channel sperm-associated protein 2 isoform X1 [Phascolarctos cinereus]
MKSAELPEVPENFEPTAVARADAVRSRLIDTFSLIDHLRGLSQAVPRHNLREFLDPARQRKLMLGDHHQLVRFSIRPAYHRIPFAQRQQCRLRVCCNPWAPISLWAGWVLRKRIFINFVNCLIFLNTIFLMIEIELVNTTDVRMLPIMMALEVGSWFILFVFILEILLFWLYNFFLFWKSAWNLFDFFVTTLSLLPEIVVLIGVTGESVWLQLLRICRVLRSLKLFARFRQIRVIILALVRALKTMTFLLVLLLIFFYIFALAGIYFFESYSRSDIQDLEYQMYFMNMPNSLVTVFILFTLDHWYALLQDAWRVPALSKAFSSLYVILWLLLGSIIFRNIIVAMMVTNFQAIRNELSEEATHSEMQHKASIFKRQIIKRRLNQKDGEKAKIRSSSGHIAPQTSHHSASLLTGEMSQTENLTKTSVPKDFTAPQEYLLVSDSLVDWETHVHQNLHGLMEMDQDEQVVWPRDSLFRYFELLEKLQYNIEERKQLQEFAVKALINLKDN